MTDVSGVGLDSAVNIPMKIDTPARMLFFTTLHLTGMSDHDPTFLTNGTGFIYEASRTPGVSAPMLVTARHVIEGATVIECSLMHRDGDGPALGKVEPLTLGDGAAMFTTHPDPRIDIAVCPLGLVVGVMGAAGKTPFLTAFTSAQCPTRQDLEEIDAIEDVTFVGYPDGQYDRVNQTPIARRGVTATPVQWDWGGAPQFLVDAAVFPGSSGSPVVIVRKFGHSSHNSMTFAEARVIFLGVLAEYIMSPAAVERADGRKADVDVRVSTGLGLVFKWTCVEETIDAFVASTGLDRGALKPNGFFDEVRTVVEQARAQGLTEWLDK